MTSQLEAFKAQAEPHTDALRMLIDCMPYRGDTSEYSQQIELGIALNKLEAAINSVRPFDLVDVDVSNSDLKLVDIAEQEFNEDQEFSDEPTMGLFQVSVWFNDAEDSTTVVEDYECLVCADCPEAVDAMKEDIAERLSVDSDLFVNIGHIETLYMPAKAEVPGSGRVLEVPAVSVETTRLVMDEIDSKYSVYSHPFREEMMLDCRDLSGETDALAEVASLLKVPVSSIIDKIVTIYL